MSGKQKKAKKPKAQPQGKKKQAKKTTTKTAKSHGIPGYGVLRGHAVEAKLEGDKPHYQIHIQAAGVDYRIAVNVMSDQAPSELLFFLDPDFHHPLLAQLPALAEGFTAVPKQPNGIALDFIRGNLFSPEEMKVVPLEHDGPGDDLHQIFEVHMQQAIARHADVYAFGSKWGPETKADQYFGFKPGNGIHDIHMNQGNAGGTRATTASGRMADYSSTSRTKTAGSPSSSPSSRRRSTPTTRRATRSRGRRRSPFPSPCRRRSRPPRAVRRHRPCPESSSLPPWSTQAATTPAARR